MLYDDFQEKDFYWSKENYRKLDERLIMNAYRFLFPEESLNSALYNKFSKFVTSKFKKLGCAVVWSRNAPDFPIGKKEVIITSSSVLTTENYTVKPYVSFSL